jgi:hypothetical protein
MAFLLTFLILVLINLALRYPLLMSSGYLNEDPALILSATRGMQLGEVLSYFYSSYGPNIIRPFQIVGIYVEQYLLGLGPEVSCLVSIVILSFSQAVLISALKVGYSSIGAWFAALLIGLSVISSEPVLWLSDRHDLYLLFFLSLCLFTCYRNLFKNAASGIIIRCFWYLLYFIALWGCFYSNEKGVVVPVIVIFLFFIEIIREESGSRFFCIKRGIPLVLISSICLTVYFLLRYSVLGVLIGGYSNTVLPASGLDFKVFVTWFLNLLNTAIRAGDEYGSWLALVFQVPLFILLVAYVCFKAGAAGKNVRSIALVVIIYLGVIVVSSLPTFRFNLSLHLSGPFNMRLFWLPQIMAAIALGALVSTGFSYADENKTKWLIICLSLVFLSVTARGGLSGVKGYAAAHDYTARAVRLFKQYCSCAQPRNPQTTGLFVGVFGVNTFTEPAWIEYHGLMAGLPYCKEKESCKLEYRNFPKNQLGVVVHKMSEEKLSAVSLPDELGLDRYPVKFYFDRFDFGNLRGGAEPAGVISGWVHESKSLKPVKNIALLINGKLVIVIQPTIIREDIFPERVGKHPVNYGFEFPVYSSSLKSGVNIVAVAVFRKGEKKFRYHLLRREEVVR